MSMNPLSDNDLAALEAIVGDPATFSDVTVIDLENRYVRLGSIYLVAWEVLNLRLSRMLQNAGSFSISGKISEGWSANIAALQKQISGVETTLDSLGLSPGGAITTTDAVRVESRR